MSRLSLRTGHPRTWLALLAMGVVTLLLLSACYWQPDNDGTGELAVSAQVRFSSVTASGGIGAQQNFSGSGELVLIVFDESFFTSPDGEEFFIFLGDDSQGSTLEELAQAKIETITFAVGSSGTVNFSGLRAGRTYVVMAFAEAEDEDESGNPVYYESVGIARATVQAGASTPVTLNLDGDYGLFYDFLIATYNLPIVDAYLAGGSVLDPNNDFTEIFEAGGVGVEYVGRSGSFYKHHLYIFQPGMDFSYSAAYNPSVAGAGRLNTQQGSFVELVVIADQLLINTWPGEIGLPLSFQQAGQTVESVRLWNGTTTIAGLASAAEPVNLFTVEAGLEPLSYYPAIKMDFNQFAAGSESSGSPPICFDFFQEYDPSNEAPLLCGGEPLDPAV